MDFHGMLEMPLDYYSIIERLGEIEYRPYETDRSEYYMDYADLFNELSILSADLYIDLERLIRELDFSWNLPRKRQEGIENANGMFWFNTATALLEETNMSLMLENEGNYDLDEETERDKRVRAVKALTKEMQFKLFTEVFNFLMRFVKLSLAYQAICGMIDELEHLHSFRERNGEILLPATAYVE